MAAIFVKRTLSILLKQSLRHLDPIFLTAAIPLSRCARSISTTPYLRDYESGHYSRLTRSGCNLTIKNVSQRVKIAGWLQFKRLGGQFLVLRDTHGIVQVAVNDPLMLLSLKDISLESVLEVIGVVAARPENKDNKDMASGAIEVIAEDLKVLNKCSTSLPFQIHDFHEVKESLRLQHRYLDLRRPHLQHNLRQRSNILFKMKEYLINEDFIDVETPILFRKTPGGAREFIVPTHDKGKAYTLPQSPQQFKQLLMVGGIERYMQVARCFRDETARPDRQPEFTQLDIEMSFVDQEDIKHKVEGMIKHSWPSHLGSIQTPFPRMDFSDAIRVYGSDKPDTRFDNLLQEVTDVFQFCEFPPFAKAFGNRPKESVQAVKFNHVSPHLCNKDISQITEVLKDSFSKNKDTFFRIIRVKEDNSWIGGLNDIGQPTLKRLQERLQLSPWDVFILSAGVNMNSCSVAGKFRTEMASLLQQKGSPLYGDDNMAFLWVENFPLFVPKEDGSEGLESAHHPFTAPHPDDVMSVYSNPETVRGQHYDLVLNGCEVAGGSIRVHDAELQRYILHNVLKEDSTSLQHLIDALESGAPPHGGIALGVDRYISILCKTQSIREVIAFPKSSEGRCLMSKAPSNVSQEVMDYYHVDFKK